MSSNPNRIALIERREVSTCFIILGSFVHWLIAIHLSRYWSCVKNLVTKLSCYTNQTTEMRQTGKSKNRKVNRLLFFAASHLGVFMLNSTSRAIARSEPRCVQGCSEDNTQ